MNNETDTRRPGSDAVMCYFMLAFPAAATPAMLFGGPESAGPQQRFEGSGGVDVILSMMVAYGFTLMVILCAYPALRGKARSLYIGNGILGAMRLALVVSLSWHNLI